jgi:hypothetical protein
MAFYKWHFTNGILQMAFFYEWDKLLGPSRYWILWDRAFCRLGCLCSKIGLGVSPSRARVWARPSPTNNTVPNNI